MSAALHFCHSPACKTHFPQGTLGLDMVLSVTILDRQAEAIRPGPPAPVSLTNGGQCWATVECPVFAGRAFPELPRWLQPEEQREAVTSLSAGTLHKP